ncbi:MAG: methyltransferase domain-containing protein [Gammaproteobacteria bacterium]|nr:methyltransferase domain-containing protein [Gammaproteobacteria bacterium]
MINFPKYSQRKIREEVDNLSKAFPVSESHLNEWAVNYGTGHIPHYASLIENIRQLVELNGFTHVVEVGSAPGHITVILKNTGLEVEAVDIYPERSAALFEGYGIPFHKVDIEQQSLPFGDNEVELVVFSEVIEHLRINPMHAIREIYRVLKPSGICLLSTPQITPLMRWRFLFGVDYQDDVVAEYEKVERLGHMGHIRLYSETEMRHISEHVGFVVERINTGGKPAGAKGDMAATILRAFFSEKMNAQIYAWLRKPAISRR